MENPLNTLLAYFKELTEGDLQEILPLVETKSINAGNVFLSPQNNRDSLCLITEGLVRIYHILENGEEKTLLFRWENTFFGNYDAIVFARPSRFYYQATEKTELLEIGYGKLKKLLEKNTALAKTERQIMMQIIGELLKRNEDFVLLSAEERYAKQIEENRAIINRVQDKHLASLLGVTPVSLSRIKKRLLKGN